MDETLPLADQIRVSIHLFTCVVCRRYQHQISVIRLLMRRRAGGEEFPGHVFGGMSPDMMERLRHRIQRAL